MSELKFPEQLLTIEEVAELLRVSPNTLSNWRSKGTGPPFLRGRPVLYQLSDLTAWNAKRRCDPAQ